MKQKRVLLLGGSFFQIPSITMTKQLGHYAITCDYRPNNPGHAFADEYHNISTTDREGVLALARKLKIDAIVCYLSDPSAPTAAFVAEKLGLPGQPLEAVEILTHKDRFRNYLHTHGFRTPLAMGFSSYEEAKEKIDDFKFPVMVKPTDSCGSKGITKLQSSEELKKAVDYALSFSIEKRILIEEFVEKDGYQIAGDGFSVNGKLVFRCFANEHFEQGMTVNYVPIGESFPYFKPRAIHDKIHSEVQRLFDCLGMRTGAYNFDIRLDTNGEVVLMEVGPRNGGNLIPQVTRYATGVDMVEYTIRAALGEDCSALQMIDPTGYWSSYMVHSKSGGVYQTVKIDEDFKKNNVVEFEMQAKQGDIVEPFTGSYGTIGSMILRFASMGEMLEKMDNMGKWVQVVTK